MRKKIYRDYSTGLLGGVASGLAGTFRIAPFLVRLLFIILFMVLGLGLFLYIALWVVLPERQSGRRITDRLTEQFQKWKRD